MSTPWSATQIRCDPGGEYGGEVIQFHMRHGIIHDVIPAEAHHRLGKIERRNALLRSITERLVDERGIADKESLDQCLIAATHTINSCTFTHGRSPYQAVFGKIPRPIGDLISDPLSLVISPDQRLLRPEVLRADAMKALAEHSASCSIRRALLRKTRHQQDLQGLQPGQAVAFWRWSAGGRVRRFISHDPDGKSIWVQVNTTTVKVANNQVRLACGWEEWTPSPEDIAMLKDAEANIRQDLWEDGREEPPGALEEATSELAGQVLDAPAPLLPRPADYWSYTDYEAIRVHLVPRYDLYVPIPRPNASSTRTTSTTSGRPTSMSMTNNLLMINGAILDALKPGSTPGRATPPFCGRGPSKHRLLKPKYLLHYHFGYLRNLLCFHVFVVEGSNLRPTCSKSNVRPTCSKSNVRPTCSKSNVRPTYDRNSIIQRFSSTRPASRRTLTTGP